MDIKLPGRHRHTAADMATNSLKECSLCEEDFNETNRCPRTLPCSHYMCADCINKMILDNKKLCPFCRYNFQANTAEDIMINRAIIEFFKYLSGRETKSVCESSLSERVAMMENEAAEVRACLHLSCEDAKKEVSGLIQSVHSLINDLEWQNGTVDKEILTIMVKMKEQNGKKQKELKDVNVKLTDRISEITKKQTKLQDMKTKPDEANTFKEAAALMDEAKVFSAALGEWIEYCKTLLREDKRKLRSMEEGIKQTKAKTEQTKNALKQIWGEASVVQQEKPQHQRPNEYKTLSIQGLQTMSEPIKSLVAQGKVFAMHLQHGTRFAKLSIRDHKLLLHHLDKERPPEDAYVFEHQQLANLTDPSLRLAFLELAVKGSSIGCLYILLSPDTDGARHFAMLCTGQMGPSYANSTALTLASKGDPGEQVRFGDYEKNNGTGGKALISGLCSREKYQRPDIDGIVTGNGWKTKNEAISAQFNIRTRGRTGKTCQVAFGQVTENFSLLTDTIQRLDNIKDLSIINCGLVLPSFLSL